MRLRDFIGQLVIVRDTTGSTFEGTLRGLEDGLLPEMHVAGCRQIHFQDATVQPMTCEWWDVGDQVFMQHHVVGVHTSRLAPREVRGR